ncbi:peptidoglycan recognition protein 1-like [Macrosteles quadrilineatus]|uniref:peptidoglycan recognition protein 1-like n=1 Tax=Macrosteles quadrilineatus TaxID=74068 RepID=UPI0023E25842|nr:peptidoglycan recognition protein 1-like [Macrosteles quadrilineatus]
MGKPKNKKIEINVEIVTREEWGALPPTKTLKLLKTPVKYIRYSFTKTEENNCLSLESCSKDLKTFQIDLMNEEYPDLPYNFLIGKDGRVYEGRGWYLEVEKHRSYKELRRKCLDITFMGQFSNSSPTNEMFEVAANLVLLGIDLKLIKEFPRVETLNDFRDYCYFEDQTR